jgi:hypothetical protein
MTIQQMLLGTTGALQFDITIAANTTNYDLLAILIAAPYNYNNTSPANITLTINSAVQVTSTSTGTPALTTGAITSNAALAIINNGSIKGKGGAGGAGGEAGTVTDFPGVAGSAAGTALNIASSLSGKVTITNGSGEIFGGGGGGGGGGSEYYTTGTGKARVSNAAGGSGGGGGAGSGAGGAGGLATDTGADFLYDGNAGAAGNTTTFGAGGTMFAGASGGNGGAFGSAGSAGVSTPDAAGGAGGAAGKAIALNGGSSPTFISGNDGTHIKGAVS